MSTGTDHLARALVDALDAAALGELADRLAPLLADRLGHEDDRWLDAKAAAVYLGMTVNAYHRLAAARASNGLPAVQDVDGGKLWAKRSELDAWRAGGGA